ncbi:hypothetical protein GYH30_045416 [Glycine max]|uniref:Protein DETOXIFICATION n=1 Tax=Glycine max TaxID=3847 RepID=A0A0R0FZ71_SOYBN|nr:hypothetical protein GYH30_045416 [Glycine max]
MYGWICVAKAEVCQPRCPGASTPYSLVLMDSSTSIYAGHIGDIELSSIAVYQAFRIQRFLQAQSKVKVIMCIAFVDLLIQNGLLYIFINVFGWGITGLAMVTNIIGSLCALALVVYTIGWCREEWRGFSQLQKRNLWAFAKLSLASSVMNCLEQCFNVQGWDYMLLLGINTAISLKDVKFVLWTETVKIRRITLPVALSQLFQFLTNSSTSIYVGRVGDIELSSISVYQGVISSI